VVYVTPIQLRGAIQVIEFVTEITIAGPRGGVEKQGEARTRNYRIYRATLGAFLHTRPLCMWQENKPLYFAAVLDIPGIKPWPATTA
jgi:hypothetical protein